ncbi:MAG: ACT domain-containing protein, partial [Gemmatimonadetes bacterium]|nr:ACT domain-containing protein [Gemmatimonadota bacterium]
RYVDRMVTVSEDQIAGAILALVESEKTVAEGAGAVSLAALLDGAAGLQGKRVAVLVSGGNIDVNLLSQIIERGLTRDGRRIRLAVQVPDRPGSLAQLTSIVAEVGANVLEVIHERAFAAGPVGTTMVRLTLETRGQTHVAEVTRRLDSEGFSVRYSGRSAADPS